MTDRPILFTGPMVRAILEGRKSQTRRVLTPQPFVDGYFEGDVDCTFVPAAASNLPAYFRFGARAVGGGAIRTETYEPRYAVGDRLYVREAWKTHAAYNDISPSAMGGDEAILYEADGAHQTWGYPAISKIGRFRQGMHMPRWASRLTLIVTDVRVQRLQEVSVEDEYAEGCESGLYFDCLWDSINADRHDGAYAWAANPWVVAISFRTIKQNIDQIEKEAV